MSIEQDINKEDAKQQKLINKGDAISARTSVMFDELRAGTFDDERSIELRELHFDGSGEVDGLFKLLIMNGTGLPASIETMFKLDSLNNFTCNFYRCKHVQKQIEEWAEEDLSKEDEDNFNESQCEQRDCE